VQIGLEIFIELTHPHTVL